MSKSSKVITSAPLRRSTRHSSRAAATNFALLCDLFTTLEQGLISEYIFDYLFLSDILHLDTAILCKQTRPNFLISLQIYMNKVLKINPMIKGIQINWFIARHIKLHNIKIFTIKIDEFIKLLTSDCCLNTLTHLDIEYGDSYFISNDIITITSHCLLLQELILSSGSEINNNTLLNISQNCPNLTLIDFKSAPFESYTTEGLQTFITNCIHLRTIRFDFNLLSSEHILQYISDTGICCGIYIDTICIDIDEYYIEMPGLFSLIIIEIIKYYPNLCNIHITGNDIEQGDVIQVEIDQGLTVLLTAYPTLPPHSSTLSPSSGPHVPTSSSSMHTPFPVSESISSSSEALISSLPTQSTPIVHTFASQIQKLNVDGLPFTRQTATIISQYINITYLQCQDCHLLDTDIILLSTTLPNLISIALGHNSDLTDTAITTLAQSCIHLTTLTIDNIPKLTDESLQSIAQYCYKLKILLIHDVPLITDTGIYAIINSCRLLTDLDICNNIYITKVCLCYICDTSISLESIAIPMYNIDVIIYMVKYARRLICITWGKHGLPLTTGGGGEVSERSHSSALKRVNKVLSEFDWDPLERVDHLMCQRKYAYGQASV